MARHKRKAPTERTKAGFEIPVPKRGEVMRSLDKIAKGGPPPESTRGSRPKK